jgi:multidrug efflux pump
MSSAGTPVADDQYYLAKAPIRRALVHLCVPMMLAISANVIYGIINAYFIGLLHNTAMLTAVTLGLPVSCLAMAIGGVFGAGGGAYISRLLGENETARIKHVAAFAFYGSLALGVLLALVCCFFRDPLVRVLGTDQWSFALTRDYVTVLLIALPVLIANFATEQIVRATGATRQSLYGMLFSIAANLVGDVLFILVLHWNVTGAALAIGLANLVSFLYYLVYLQRRSGTVNLALKHFRWTRTIAGQVFSIGISELIMSSFMIVTVLLFNNIAVHYGDDVIAALGVAQRIVQLPEFLCAGIFMGVAPLFGYAYGARNWRRLRGALLQSVTAIAGLIVIFATLVYLFRVPIFRCFTTSPHVIAVGCAILTALLVSSLFNGFTGLLIAYFQTTNKPLQTTLMSVAQGALFIPVILIAHALWGLPGMIWSMTITELLVCLLGLTLFVLNKETSKLAFNGEGVIGSLTGQPVLVE